MFVPYERSFATQKIILHYTKISYMIVLNNTLNVMEI